MHSLAFNLFDGLLRGIFFLVYIVAISRMKDIHRVFQYHGAEHKVVFAWEAGRGADGRQRARAEPAASALRHELPALRAAGLDRALRADPEDRAVPDQVRRPAAAGAADRRPLLRGAAPDREARAARPCSALLVAPGLVLQRITTQEPTDDMLEVAIVALEEALREDGLMPEAVADRGGGPGPGLKRKPMFDKLSQIEKTHEELTQRLADPSVLSDHKAYTETNKALAEISTTVQLYREYKRAKQQSRETEEMLAGLSKDDELYEMAREEREQLAAAGPGAGGRSCASS